MSKLVPNAWNECHLIYNNLTKSLNSWVLRDKTMNEYKVILVLNVINYFWKIKTSA